MEMPTPLHARRVTREELYRMVWDKPMIRLAEDDSSRASIGREMVLWEFEDLKKSSLLTNSNHASH